MAHERWKSSVAVEILRRETNVHFLNPQTNKIGIKLFVTHRYEKDEHSNEALETYPFDDSIFSENQLLCKVSFNRDDDNEST